MRLDHNAPYFDSTADGRFVLQRCTTCGRIPNFPRVACPRCLSELEWFDASGNGSVLTFTVVHRPHDRQRFDQYVPIVMALIALEEGAETIATLVGDDRVDVLVGDAVEFSPEGSWSELPQFRRIGD